jgi:myo-inositol-1(or 4)-monophosphatase
MAHIYDHYLKFAQAMAKKGGAILRANFGRLSAGQIHSKGAHDVVTSADKKVESMYAELIKKTFPAHGIIGEEGTSKSPGREWVWILDPLDGTKNYSIGNPFFCTSICLLHNGQPALSVIYEPITNNLYHAVKGGGAFLNGRKIHVSKNADIKKSMLLYCHAATPAAIKEMEHIVVRLKLAARDAARLRAAGSEMALIAKGSCDAYLMNQLPIWDLAPGALLVREAGGRATDFDGNEWMPGFNTIIVSNGSAIHQEVIKIIRSLQ